MPILKKSAPKKAKKTRVKTEMEKFKKNELHSGSKTGPIVTNPKQAIAISLHEAGVSKKQSKPKRGHRAKVMREALKKRK